MNHIKDCLPKLRDKISKLLATAQSEMVTYGDPLYDGKNSQGALLLQIITKFSNDFRNTIEGKSTDHSFQELYGGARINVIFTDHFAETLKSIDPSDGMTMNDIRTVIRNATGPRAALFVPEAAFDLLVRRQIARFEEPSLHCIEQVYEELQRIVGHLESKELMRFGVLRERVVDVVNALLQKCRTPTQIMIGNLVSIELSYVNTNHPDFAGGGGAITELFTKMQLQQQQQQYQQQQQQHQQYLQAQQNNQYDQQQQYAQQQMMQPQDSSKKKKIKTKKNEIKPLAPSPNNPNNQNAGFFGMFFNKDADVKQQQQQAPALPQQNNNNQQMMQQQQGRKSSRSGRVTTKSTKLPPVPASIRTTNAPSDRERFETELIQRLLVSYFNIVRKNIQDSVPKSIMHFLVNQSKDNVQNELVAHLYKEELFDELLEESPAIAQRRRECKQRLDVLRKAQSILNEVRDTAI